MLQNVREFIQQRVTASQWARAALSLLIALVLWGWVTQLQDPVETQRYAEVTIEPPELPGTIQIVTSLPRATVSITDVSSRLDEISRSDLLVSLDPDRIDGPGTYELPVTVELEESVRELRVSPDTVSVEVEEQVNRNFPLTVETQVSPDDTRRITETRPEVTQVTITGTSSVVDRIERVVLPVAVSGRTSDFVEMIEPYAVNAENQRVQEVEISPSHVRTEIELEARGKTVSIVPQVRGAPAEGFVVQQQIAVPSTIIVDGPPEALESLLFINTEPVDITGASESISRMVALEGLPDGVALIEPEENRIEVRVSIGATGGSANTIPDMPVEVVNLPSGMIANVDPTTVDIDVSAPSDLLTDLTSEDVQVTIDAGGLGPGVYTLTPDVRLPDEVNVVRLEPEQVVVVISGDGATPAAQGSRGSRLALNTEP